ncbi:hypothetical protein VPHK379_0014 [Vibrio phage K379]
MQATNTKITDIEVGEFKGLRIEEIAIDKLNGMKGVKVTHRMIAGFEARALVALTVGTGDILKEVRESVRLTF